MMQPYKGYFIEGSALMVHPFSPDWYVGGSVLVPGRSSSIVEITRFQLHQFTVSIKELAEWFGLEIARIVVDECLRERETEWQICVPRASTEPLRAHNCDSKKVLPVTFWLRFSSAARSSPATRPLRGTGARFRVRCVLVS